MSVIHHQMMMDLQVLNSLAPFYEETNKVADLNNENFSSKEDWFLELDYSIK